MREEIVEESQWVFIYSSREEERGGENWKQNRYVGACVINTVDKKERLIHGGCETRERGEKRETVRTSSTVLYLGRRSHYVQPARGFMSTVVGKGGRGKEDDRKRKVAE